MLYETDTLRMKAVLVSFSERYYKRRGRGGGGGGEGERGEMRSKIKK